MTLLLIAALVAVNIAYLFAHDRDGKRQAKTTAELVGTLERERDARRDELQTLLQRIQAPQQAVVEHSQRLPVPEENPYPLTEAESVEAQDERMRVIAQIERMQREGLEGLFSGEVS